MTLGVSTASSEIARVSDARIASSKKKDRERISAINYSATQHARFIKGDTPK